MEDWKGIWKGKGKGKAYSSYQWDRWSGTVSIVSALVSKQEASADTK